MQCLVPRASDYTYGSYARTLDATDDHAVPRTSGPGKLLPRPRQTIRRQHDHAVPRTSCLGPPYSCYASPSDANTTHTTRSDDPCYFSLPPGVESACVCVRVNNITTGTTTLINTITTQSSICSYQCDNCESHQVLRLQSPCLCTTLPT